MARGHAGRKPNTREGDNTNVNLGNEAELSDRGLPAMGGGCTRNSNGALARQADSRKRIDQRQTEQRSPDRVMRAASIVGFHARPGPSMHLDSESGVRLKQFAHT